MYNQDTRIGCTINRPHKASHTRQHIRLSPCFSTEHEHTWHRMAARGMHRTPEGFKRSGCAAPPYQPGRNPETIYHTVARRNGRNLCAIRVYYVVECSGGFCTSMCLRVSEMVSIYICGDRAFVKRGGGGCCAPCICAGWMVNLRSVYVLAWWRFGYLFARQFCLWSCLSFAVAILLHTTIDPIRSRTFFDSL